MKESSRKYVAMLDFAGLRRTSSTSRISQSGMSVNVDHNNSPHYKGSSVTYPIVNKRPQPSTFLSQSRQINDSTSRIRRNVSQDTSYIHRVGVRHTTFNNIRNDEVEVEVRKLIGILDSCIEEIVHFAIADSWNRDNESTYCEKEPQQ